MIVVPGTVLAAIRRERRTRMACLNVMTGAEQRGRRGPGFFLDTCQEEGYHAIV
jgi:hypothetical protein